MYRVSHSESTADRRLSLSVTSFAIFVLSLLKEFIGNAENKGRVRGLG
jgi:hypothetical protein